MSIKKILWIGCLFVIFCKTTLAVEVDVKLDPERPVINEPYRLIITISSNDIKPFLEFTPRNLEIIGRQIQTGVLVPGRAQKYDTIYTFKAVSVSSGYASLEKIRVSADGETHNYKRADFSIRSIAAKPKHVFVEAELDRTSIFVGEGVKLSYYLYTSGRTINDEIEQFPKLSNFIKRYFEPFNMEERVSRDGLLYRRRSKYLSYIYPQRAGNLKVDPIVLKVKSESRRGGFGYPYNFSEKSFRSKVVNLKVLKLPEEGKEDHFTGLVGKHSFQVSTKKTNFLVNDVLEIKLTVAGRGALELMSPPKLIENENLEEFDTKVDLEPKRDGTAVKTFSYTYLVRGPFKPTNYKKRLSYFNPHLGVYENVDLNIGTFSATGEAIAKNVDKNEYAPTKKESTEILKPKLTLVGPIFSSWARKGLNFKVIQRLLLLLIFMMLVWISFDLRAFQHSDDRYRAILRKIKKSKDLEYALLYDFLEGLDPNQRGPQAITEAIQSSSLSDSCKDYFLELIQDVNRGTYGTEKGANFTYKDNYFKELLGQINSIKN